MLLADLDYSGRAPGTLTAHDFSALEGLYYAEDAAGAAEQHAALGDAGARFVLRAQLPARVKIFRPGMLGSQEFDGERLRLRLDERSCIVKAMLG